MPMYETIFIADPALPEPDADSLAETFHQIVSEGEGSIKKAEGWGKKKLAYAVRKQQEGYYYHLRYEAPSAALSELERRLRNHEQILKYLSVRLNREALAAVEVSEQKAAEKAAARAAREAERAARQAEAAAAAEAAGIPLPGAASDAEAGATPATPAAGAEGPPAAEPAAATAEPVEEAAKSDAVAEAAVSSTEAADSSPDSSSDASDDKKVTPEPTEG